MNKAELERQDTTHLEDHRGSESAQPSSGVREKPRARVDARVLLGLPATATRQFDLCVVVPIAESGLSRVREQLALVREQTIRAMRGAPAADALIDWASIPGLHYARWVIIDSQHKGSPALLALSTCYDGPLGDSNCSRRRAETAHLEALVHSIGHTLDVVFDCCEGYPGPAALEEYLAHHVVDAATFYCGSTGRCRDQVLGEAALRLRVQAVVDRLYVDAPELSPEDVRNRVREQIGLEFEAAAPPQSTTEPRTRSHELRALPPFPAQPDRTLWVDFTKEAAVAVGALSVGALVSGILPLQLASAGLLGVIGLSAFLLRWHEQRDAEYEPEYSEHERTHIDQVSQDEDLFLQNELTHLVDLKPGWLRHGLIRLVFLALGFLARNLYNKGKLGSIPSIHFARWCRIDGGRILFFSNFDGSWQSYLGDFIDQASSGLTAVWSNTVLYPRTRWLVQAGSEDAGRFKAWTRHYQIRTQVWFAAYPGLSIRTVNANTEIRRGLADPECMPAHVWLDWLQGLDRASADALHAAERANPSLTRTESASPQSSAQLALEDVQGLVLRGYGGKKGTEFLLLQVDQERATSAREWLSGLDLTHAEHARERKHGPHTFLNLALSHRGLRALGIQAELLDDFPLAFVQGAEHSQRCRVNGDIGANAPEHWRWGSAERGIDVLLLVYAPDRERACEEADALLARAQSAGLRLVERLQGGELPGRKEHFGFRDGIAQPVVRGTRAKEPHYNTLPPGEFLLGHPDTYGNTAHTPGARSGDAFGTNGSYLVFRQLAQDVGGFWQYCAAQAERLHTDAVTIAAKMVGRWPSGASLVKHPDRDPERAEYQDEDRFAYLANGHHNDRGGAACPFGAHVRRTNPRDWDVGASRQDSLEIANRHRLIRRGRPYGPPLSENMSAQELAARSGSDATPERGLHFLAFSGDLERQFEFVQQQWLQNGSFAGLQSAEDAIAGTGTDHDETDHPFTIQRDSTESSFGRCLGLPAFVELRGAAYFFMPSISAVRRLPDLASGPFRV